MVDLTFYNLPVAWCLQFACYSVLAICLLLGASFDGRMIACLLQVAILQADLGPYWSKGSTNYLDHVPRKVFRTALICR